MTMNSRIPDRIKENVPESVAVVGVGGIGSWVAFMMGQMNEVKRIGLFDEDVIEQSNIERTPYSFEDLARKKSKVMKEYILARSEDKEVIAYDHLTDDNKNLLNLYDLVVVCADSGVVRNMVLESHENSISAGYDVDEEKDWISVSEQTMWFAGEAEEDDEYTIEPSWSGPAMQGALIVMTSILNDRRPADISCKMTDFYKQVEDSNGRKVYDVYDDVDDPEELIREHEEEMSRQDSQISTPDSGSEPWSFGFGSMSDSTIEFQTDEETITFDGEITLPSEYDSVSDFIEAEFGDVATPLTREQIEEYFDVEEYLSRFLFVAQAYEVIETEMITEINCPTCGQNSLDSDDVYVFCLDEISPDCNYERTREEFTRYLEERDIIPPYESECPECNDHRVVTMRSLTNEVPEIIDAIRGCVNCGHIIDIEMRGD